jgi:phospholipid/cholesterol/gamma-HCH transport system ATP-binding protein
VSGANPDRPAIKLDRVSKAFGTKRVLDNVSFEVQQGQGFCILGRSGTGKSVTLKHIIGLMKPDRGRVFIEGRDITDLGSRELAPVRKRMGFVFQNGALFDSISIGENVAFVLRRHTNLHESEIRDAARERLARVGLERDYDRMPADLSGGMRKRAGLARAMALDPPILLVDEPSAGLDPITSDEIDQLLLSRKEQAGTTLVVVTHNIPSAKRLADSFVMLHEGQIIARGSADELLASGDPLVSAFMHSTHSG